MKVSCPVCKGQSAQLIYTLNNVPVHSVRLALSPQESVDMQRGNIELYGCDYCGMVWNNAFDAQLMQYDSVYEETQAYSATFNDFHQWLVNYLIDTYAMRGKSVIEIGCGKGEFLNLLANSGISEGVGFDPSFDSTRFQQHANLSFKKEFFPPSGEHPTADFYICKMTLEHIDQPRQFIAELSAYIGDDNATVVVQVPALQRILDEFAYWDIYYEHCNYFSASSLRYLFTSNGFEIVEISNIYADQYINVVARSGNARKLLLQPQGVLDTAQFTTGVQERLEQWRNLLVPFAQNNALLIWGAASKAVGLVSAIPELKIGTRLVDINPNKQGSYLPSTELKIESPENLRNAKLKLIVVANPIYMEEVKTEVLRLNISGSVIALSEFPTAH